MQIHQTDFSTGNVYRNIMEVAVPMIIAQILNLLYNIVDRIYIGRIPEIGATALTGVCFEDKRGFSPILEKTEGKHVGGR